MKQINLTPGQIEEPRFPGDYLGDTFYGNPMTPHSPTHIWKPDYTVDKNTMVWIPLNQEERAKSFVDADFADLERRVLAIEKHLNLK